MVIINYPHYIMHAELRSRNRSVLSVEHKKWLSVVKSPSLLAEYALHTHTPAHLYLIGSQNLVEN